MIKLVAIIALNFIVLNLAQAENNLDLWGKRNLAWEEENRPTANFLSDIGLYSLIGTAVVYASTEYSLKHGLAATATLGVNAGINQLVKYQVGRERPDGSDNLSFYSGHTSNSFAASGILCLASKKICPYGLALATSVGLLRVSANKHWLSDVLIGGGIGYVNGRYLPTLVLRW